MNEIYNNSIDPDFEDELLPEYDFDYQKMKPNRFAVPSNQEMSKKMIIYSFVCSNKTYNECIERSLFGNNNAWPEQVRKGDYCILYNSSKHKILYLWKAVCDGRKDIEKNAWNGNYPYQVRVQKCTEEIYDISLDDLDTQARKQVTQGEKPIEGKDAEALLNLLFKNEKKQLETLLDLEKIKDEDKPLELFLDPENLKIEKDYRQEYPATFRCRDGHYVRSKAEKIIDDYFTEYKLFHMYEPHIVNLPERDRLIPDFKVYNKDHKEIYIEYWGMLDKPNYYQRMKRKQEIYKKHNLRCIDLYDRDIENIDFNLSEKLKKFKVL
ncbi:hypothetical protein V0288_05030 [Pannus brasiliensis CCIBt3594]|uniref:DCD domain-containing protein n=2 Tax=Bacillati TaxID=1783272 RepID=A0AAW9QHI9_9CHRO